jgi:hypothetical protein
LSHPPQDDDLPSVPDLPSEVQDVLERLTKGSAEYSRKVGEATSTLCDAYIRDTLSDHTRDVFEKLWKEVGDEWWSIEEQNSLRMRLTRRQDDPSSVFRSYSFFHVELIAKDLDRIFRALRETDVAIDRAEAETRRIAHNRRKDYVDWVRRARDRNHIDLWQAPEKFGDQFVQRVEECIGKAATDAALKQAKHDEPSPAKVIDAKLDQPPAPKAPPEETRGEGSSGKAQAQEEEPPKPVQSEMSEGNVEGKRKKWARGVKKANPKKEKHVEDKINGGKDIRKSEAVAYWRRDRATISNWLEKDKITLRARGLIPNRVARRWLTEHPQAPVADA